MILGGKSTSGVHSYDGVFVGTCNSAVTEGAGHSEPRSARRKLLDLVSLARSSNSFLQLVPRLFEMLFFLAGSVRPLLVPRRSYTTSRSYEKRRRSLRSSSLPRHSPLTLSSPSATLP